MKRWGQPPDTVARVANPGLRAYHIGMDWECPIGKGPRRMRRGLLFSRIYLQPPPFDLARPATPELATQNLESPIGLTRVQ